MYLSIAIIIALSGAPKGNSWMTADPAEYNTTDWKLETESGDIKLYSRWVQINEDLRVRERKGIFTAHCTVEQAVLYICDASNALFWMKGVKESYILKKYPESEWSTYMLYSVPWPFDNRDLVSHYKMKRDTVAIRIIVDMDSEEGIIPEKEGVQRIKTFHGSWELDQINDQQTRVIFVARTDEGPAFPRWIQDPVVRKAFMSNLRKLQQILNEQLVLE